MEFRREPSPAGPVVYTTADRSGAAYAGALMLLVLVVFLFGLMFLVNYDGLHNWFAGQVIDNPVPQQQIIPVPSPTVVPVPVPTATPAPVVIPQVTPAP